MNASFVSALLLRSLFGTDEPGGFDLKSMADKPPDFTQLVKDAVRQIGNCPDVEDDAVLVCGRRRQSYRIEPEMLKSMRGERSRYDRYRLGNGSAKKESSLPPARAILDRIAR